MLELQLEQLKQSIGGVLLNPWIRGVLVISSLNVVLMEIQ